MLRLLVLSVAVAVLGVTLAASVQPSAGLIPPIPCHAKFGVNENEGEHPFLWPLQYDMDFFVLAQNGVTDFSYATNNSIIPVEGTIDEDGEATAHGQGMYSVFQTTANFTAEMSYWRMDRQFPMRFSGDYDVGADGNLPGGKTIKIHSECFFNPPAEIADEDNDSRPGALHVQSQYSSTSTGHMEGDDNQAVVVTKKDQSVQEVNIADAGSFETEDEKSGPFEAALERKFAAMRGEFGGAFNPQESEIKITLPPELGGGTTPLSVSGYLRGMFLMNAQATDVRRFDFDFSVAGESFDFMGGQAETGPWTWKIDPDRDVTSIVNPATGQFTLTVPTLFDAPYLRRLLSEPQAGGEGAPATGPLRFVETVTGTFGPFSQVAAALDNCPAIANADQADADEDGVGDACEGVFWADADCNGFVGAIDALRTATLLSGIASPVTGCPGFGDAVGDGLAFGDWRCDGEPSAEDILVPLLHRAGIAPVGLPAGCPEADEFISSVG